MVTISALKSDRVGSIRHPLGGGERERQHRLFERNAALAAQYGDNRRGFYAAMAAMTPIAAGVSFAEVKEPTVTGWWATPETDRRDRVILFIHGGGYHLGDAASYRGLGSHVAALTHCPVFLMDYPLAPEHRFPAAYDAAIRARDWLALSGIERLALVGDSAGGGLALAIQNEPLPKASLACTCVFSPWTDLALTGDSFKDPNIHDPVFKPEVLAGLASSYLDGANPRDGRASPLFSIPDDLAPLYIQVGSDELLLDDSQSYAQLAAQKGTEVRLDVFEGMHHVFQRDVGGIETAAVALGLAANFIAKHW